MSTRPPRPGRTRLPAVTAALALLVSTALSASQAADAADPGAGTPKAGPTEGIPLPGLHDPSYTVTLPTGDQVTLTDAGNGHYSITATPVSGAGPGISVTAHGGPNRATTVSATPLLAGTLIADRTVDRNLFDVTWLAAHGDTGAHARIPVTVQYAGQQTAATLASKAAALTGATLAASHPTSGTVDLTIAASDAHRFWAALTGTTAASNAVPTTLGPTHLSGGAVHAWPTGHRSAVAAAPSATEQPLFHLTERIVRNTDAVPCVDTTLCLGPNQNAFGVVGEAAGQVFDPTSVACVNSNPCTTWEVRYDLPLGIYSLEGTAVFDDQRRLQLMDLLEPQVTLAGDTTVTIDADAAQKVTFDTPRPAEAFTAHLDDYRSTPDGTWITNLSFGVLMPGLWATPTDRVSVGTFHLAGGWMLGQPTLTMTMTTPQRHDLGAVYWTTEPFAAAGNEGAVRFDSRKNVQIVRAGHGSAEDFAAVDARGKLALITVNSVPGCTVLNDQLDNAIDAGAIGVLVDPTDPAQIDDCYLPMFPEYHGTTKPVPDIPFAELTVEQVKPLIDLLAHGTVTVDIDSYPRNAPYLYTLDPTWEGRVPESLKVTLSGAQLQRVTNHYHADQPTTAKLNEATWRPNGWFVGAIPPILITVPDIIEEYRGPVSPDTVHMRNYSTDQGASIEDVLGDNGATVEDWGAGPFAPGAQLVSSGILNAQPGKWDSSAQALAACAFCRQGDFFYPLGHRSSGSDPLTAPGVAMGFAGQDIHLYRNGTEIPQTVQGGFVSFQLPAERDRYELTSDIADIRTTWHFTSAAPTSGHKPAGYGCVGSVFGSTAPCAADPLLFLRYDAHTDLANTVAAAGNHQLDVTAYHQATDAPAATALKLWTSTDGGTTWRPATVRAGRDGTYTATYTLPALSGTNGSLSIKAQASDAGGNDITQILTDAVKLTATTPAHH